MERISCELCVYESVHDRDYLNKLYPKNRRETEFMQERYYALQKHASQKKKKKKKKSSIHFFHIYMSVADLCIIQKINQNTFASYNIMSVTDLCIIKKISIFFLLICP